MQLTDDQVDYFARVSFMRGVLAERMGLLGNVRGLISEQDSFLISESLRTLEVIEDGLYAMAGGYSR
jgi:hypothetical protein